MAFDALGFAATKIQPPRRRSGWLARPVLAERIAQGLQSAPLTLLCAPGGFGKSSAIVEALAHASLRFAWIACDEGDTMVRLASALVASLEPFDLPWRSSPEALVAALERDDGPRAFRDALVNALAATDLPRGVIVLDDLHRWADGRLHDFLAGLPALLPEHWGLALVTRVDPPWSLSRLRVAGDLAEIRQQELRFSAHEVAHLAEAAGRPDAAPALLARTEGWPVGVTLAMGNARIASPVRSEQHALEYLRSEVLDDLPAALRGFLVQSSVLPELTAPRAAAVTGRPDSAHFLDEIERRGLFFQEVESHERTLRLHDIFRAALEGERERLPAAEQQPLWLHAAQSEPDTARRFDYLLRAAAYEEAIALLTRTASALIAAGMLETVDQMVRKLPPPLLADAPEVALLRGMMAWERMDLRAMREQTMQAARAYAARGEREGHDLARAYVALAINGMSPIGRPESDPAYEVAIDASTPARTRVIVALHRAWHAFDLADFVTTNREYGVAYDHLEQDPDAALWYQVTPGMAYFGVRALEPTLARYADAAERVAGEDYTALRAIALAVRGGVHLWRGRLAEARAQLDEAASLSAWINYPHTLSVYSLVLRLLCRTVQGEIDAALPAFHDELSRVSDTVGPDGRGPVWYFHWYELRCCLLAERRDRAHAALAALRRTMPAGVTVSHTGVVRIIDAYEAWLEGRRVAALEGMRASLAGYGDNDAVGIVTTLNLQRAALSLELGDEAESAQALRLAMDAIRLRGYELSARFAGAACLRALAGSRAARALEPPQAAVLARLVARPGGEPSTPAFDDASAAPHTLSAQGIANEAVVPARLVEPADGSGEPISPREMEVLAFLAAGDSNKIIARRLDLSPHTVKRHVANILGKLGVESRGQAAARYRGQRQ